MNFTNFSINLTSGYPDITSCADKFDYQALQMCEQSSLSNIIVFGGLWIAFFVVNILHNKGVIDDKRYIRVIKTLLTAYILLGTIAIGNMIVTYIIV